MKDTVNEALLFSQATEATTRNNEKLGVQTQNPWHVFGNRSLSVSSSSGTRHATRMVLTAKNNHHRGIKS
jgi:hypothetical protein